MTSINTECKDAGEDCTRLLYEAKERGLIDELGDALAKDAWSLVPDILSAIKAIGGGRVMTLRLLAGDGTLVEQVGNCISMETAAIVVKGGNRTYTLVAMLDQAQDVDKGVAWEPGSGIELDEGTGGGAPGRESLTIAWIGPSGAGKTTLIHRLKFGEYVQPRPTIGVNMDSVHFKGKEIQNLELSGQFELRHSWRDFIRNKLHPDALVVVLDLTCEDSINETTKWIQVDENIIESLLDIPLIILLNKQDVGERIPDEMLKNVLGLPFVQPSFKNGIFKDKQRYHDGMENGKRKILHFLEVSGATGMGIDDLLHFVDELIVHGGEKPT